MNRELDVVTLTGKEYDDLVERKDRLEQKLYALQHESNQWLDKELRLTARCDRYRIALEKIAMAQVGSILHRRAPHIAKEALDLPAAPTPA